MTIDRAIEILDPEHREFYDGMDEVNEACRMGMEALKRNRWIPCSERLPRECGKYLAAVESEAFRGLRYVDILRYDEIGWRDGCCYVNGVSHWMPLPEPPEENECAEK